MKNASILLNLALIGLLVFFTTGVKQEQSQVTAKPALRTNHLNFIPNQGQVNQKAIFYAKASHYTLWMTKEGLVFDSSRTPPFGHPSQERHTPPFGHPSQEGINKHPHSPHSPHSSYSPKPGRDVSRLFFIDAQKNPEMVPVEETKLKVNYFKGNDQSRWYHGIPTSQAVLYKSVYSNIDLKVYGVEKQVEYDWIVKPGGNPGDIKFEYKNVKKTRIDEEGNLIIETRFGELIHKKPVSYQGARSEHGAWSMEQGAGSRGLGKKCMAQDSNVGAGLRACPTKRPACPQERKQVNVTFKKIDKNTYGFRVGEYDKSSELIIDPVVMVYSTYLGGKGWEESQAIAVDNNGYAYVTGTTWSTDFPLRDQYLTDPGKEDYDVFVTKIDTRGKGDSSLIYSTYLGGTDSDSGSSIAVDNKGNVYVTGNTWSEDFPFKKSYQSYQGEGDVFVARLDTTRSGASSLIYSTCLGGGDEDTGLGIAADNKGNVFVTGWTYSLDFPTRNAYQAEPGEDFTNAFVTQIDTGSSGASGLIYSSYLGGKKSDGGTDIAVDNNGIIYITGWTYSPDFPTRNPFQTDKGYADAFITKMDPLRSGTSSLVYSTYLGGGSADYGESIAIDDNNSGYVYVTGITRSSNFPTRNSFQKDQGGDDVFITGIDTNKSGSPGLLYSTYLGGDNSDKGYGIAVESSSGYVCVTGVTKSSNFPAYRSYQDYQGDEDAFVTQLDTSHSGSSSLIFSGYLGGKNSDGGNDIAADDNGNIYVTGWTLSTDFPVMNQYRTDPGDLDYDGFITRLSIEPDEPPAVGLSRTYLDFSAVSDGGHTGAQTFLISNIGGGSLEWTAAPSHSWLLVEPAVGTDETMVTVSVDPTGLSPGSTTGTIDISAPDASNTPQTVEVTLTVYNPGSSTPPFGHYSTPIDGSAVSSSIPVTGWVLDDIGVESVKIYRGEGKSLIYIGEAVFVEGARPDIEAAYPGYPMNYQAGWGYMMLTNFLPDNGNGTFNIHAIARDIEGQEVTLGTKTIIVDNANAVKPFGAIDTPTQGGSAAGSGFINWGWVLTPQPNTIPVDGSTIKVWVDGIALGHPVYNINRSDIAQLFPGYNNSGGAAGYFKLDTTAFTNGVHTLQWTAADDAGNTDGIGSRYFAVQNTGTSPGNRAQSAGLKAQYEDYRIDIKEIPGESSYEPITVKKGFDETNDPLEIFPDENGLITIGIEELQRIEIHLPGTKGLFPSYYIGRQLVGRQLRQLPIGSFLDRKEGIFYWQPGPGFTGNYRLEFIQEIQPGQWNKINIWLNILPKVVK